MVAVNRDNTKDVSGAARWRMPAAWLLLTLPLFAYPLEWLNVFRPSVPFWDMAAMFMPSVMALFALAVLGMAGIGALRRACVRSRLNALLVWSTLGLLLLSIGRSLYYGTRLEPAEWFFVVPLAGMVLSREILRILPKWGTLTLAVLLYFTWRFPFCIGLPGNWNWNFSLLTVLIPAPFLLSGKLPARHFWLATAVAAAFLTVMSILYPELAPRGTIVGVIAAWAVLLLLWKIHRRQRLIVMVLGAGAGVAMFLSIWLGPADSTIRSSRFWLWRGSTELALGRSFFGIGAGNFERHINQHLPKEYYFSDYATNFHPHPHNELLAAWCVHGGIGLVVLLSLSLAACAGLRIYSAVRVWGFWIFLVLLVHGQFDVLLQTPLAGTLWLAVGGALAGGMVRHDGKSHPVPGIVGAAVTAGFAAVIFISGWWARESMLNSRSGDRESARRNLEKSLALWQTPDVRYRLGMVALFDFNDLPTAIAHFEKLAPGYIHSNGYLARAYALKGDPETALRYFERESRFYPMSALNAFWELEVMRVQGYDPVYLSSRRSRLNYLLKLRGLTVDRIDELIYRPALDDIPLRNP